MKVVIGGSNNAVLPGVGYPLSGYKVLLSVSVITSPPNKIPCSSGTYCFLLGVTCYLNILTSLFTRP